MIWDFAVSIFRYLLQGEPRAVHAVGASHSPSGLEDVAYVTLTYDHDLLVLCHVNWFSPVKIRQTLVAGSEKMLVWKETATRSLREGGRPVEFASMPTVESPVRRRHSSPELSAG